MPILLLAGVPRRAFRRKKAISPSINLIGWTVEVFESDSDEPTVARCWPKLCARVEEIDRNDCDGVHILAFDRDESQFARLYEAAMRDHHRIRRLPSELIQNYGTEYFNVQLTANIVVEEQWREYLRPAEASEPVILPEGYFDVPVPFNDVWQRVRDFDGTQDIAAVQSLVANFKVRYRGEQYRDTRGLLFKTRGERHGEYRSAIYNWKYGLRLPKAFHFDLMDERKRPFGFQCRDQARKTYNTHCNIDAFGFEVTASSPVV